ncbi:MAG: hypothetical protein HY674_13295 [Chloroflexi bacterium]|nr:hypothetical protein [Chloroflexota bacterium]
MIRDDLDRLDVWEPVALWDRRSRELDLRNEIDSLFQGNGVQSAERWILKEVIGVVGSVAMSEVGSIVWVIKLWIVFGE